MSQWTKVTSCAYQLTDRIGVLVHCCRCSVRVCVSDSLRRDVTYRSYRNVNCWMWHQYHHQNCDIVVRVMPLSLSLCLSLSQPVGYLFVILVLIFSAWRIKWLTDRLGKCLVRKCWVFKWEESFGYCGNERCNCALRCVCLWDFTEKREDNMWTWGEEVMGYWGKNRNEVLHYGHSSSSITTTTTTIVVVVDVGSCIAHYYYYYYYCCWCRVLYNSVLLLLLLLLLMQGPV